jgi:TrmH family RNA methyltransferase
MNENRFSSREVSKILARARALTYRPARENERCFWIEGVRHFVQAVDAKMEIDTVLLSPVLLKSRLAEMLPRRLSARGVRSLRISPEQFRSICGDRRASGIGAIVKQRWIPLTKAWPNRGLCWIVLSDVRSPGNLGTILRTAEAVQASGIVFVDSRCDPFEPTVVRASMGGLFHLQLARASHKDLQRWAARHGIQLVGLSPEADSLWTELPTGSPIALVLGEEHTGLADSLRAICHTTVRLPMWGCADSLNVGVAAGVMMYELVRRRSLSQVVQPKARK